jgi:hypothetical protein
MFRTVFAGAALVLCTTQLSAQITTYVAPPRPLAASPQLVAATDSARRDSVSQATVTNMKAWVDSAAGVSVPAHVGDSIPANDPGRPDPVVTTFESGSVAPATASSLPTLLAFGGLALALGVALRMRRPRREQ